MKHRHLFCLLLWACDGTGERAPSPASRSAPLTGLGEVVADGTCDLPTLFVGATCERHIVTCEGLEPATVNLVIAEPPPGVALRGTVVLGSGSMGATLIEKATIEADGTSHFVAEMELLRSRGYRLIERAWQGDVAADRGWFRGSEGPDDSACRYATLVDWLADRFTEDAAFCALGFSGGSVELALAMTRWDLGDRLDHATFVSGPAGRFDTACIGGPEAEAERDLALAAHPWECPTPLSPVLGDDITLLVDRAYEGEAVCSSRDPIHTGTLFEDSALGPEGTDTFPTTGVHVVLGMRDCGSGAATAGATFATEVLGADGPPVILEIAGAGHSLHATAQGARALRQVLRSHCRKP